jgi:hypothetical protein
MPSSQESIVKLRYAGVGIVFVIVALAGWLGLKAGWTIDNDSFALQDSFQSIIDGGYRPSRTSGYPLYEFLGAPVWQIGGIQL